MVIEKIILKNFRNFKNLIFEPCEHINYIVGQNAQGKTNFIESIYFCSFFKSYRTNNLLNLINKDSDFFFIELTVKGETVKNKISIGYDKKRTKSIKVNDKIPENNIFFKNINSIIYYPDEINFLCIYPQYRRNFIDRSIFLTDFDFLNIYGKYKKILKNRNCILKSKNYNEDLDLAWCEELSKLASIIVIKRNEYIKRINLSLKEDNFNNEIYSIKYTKYDLENIEKNILSKILKSKEKDLKLGYTTVGPHCDDFIFEINNNDIRKFSSEGQKKSFILKYKKSQIFDYKNIYNFYPVLILDDISNELDSKRKNKYLYDILSNTGQVFVTTTDSKNINSDKNNVFKVVNGQIIY